MTTGVARIEQWIEENSRSLTGEEMSDTIFIFKDSVYTLKKTDAGAFDVVQSSGKVVVFRNEQETDDFTCKICGGHHDNRIETIRCCMDRHD